MILLQRELFIAFAVLGWMVLARLRVSVMKSARDTRKLIFGAEVAIDRFARNVNTVTVSGRKLKFRAHQIYVW